MYVDSVPRPILHHRNRSTPGVESRKVRVTATRKVHVTGG